MKRIILVVLILIMATFCFGCEVDGKYGQLSEPMNLVNEHKGEIYYISPIDQKLYKFDGQGKSELVYDRKMISFTITQEFLVYIDTNGKLTTLDLDSQETNTIDWDIGELFKCIVYDHRVVYIDSNDDIRVIDFDGKHLRTVGDRDVSTMQACGNAIYYVADRISILPPGMKIVKMDLRGNKKNLFNCHVYRMDVHGRDIFYISDHYDVVRVNIDTLEEKTVVKNVRLGALEVTEKHVICVSSKGIVICDWDGRNVDIAGQGSQLRLLDASDDVVVYIDDTTHHVGVYQIDGHETVTMDEPCQKAVILDDMIFFAFEATVLHSGFYSFDGLLLYDVEQE